jgi:hypothetical protein
LSFRTATKNYIFYTAFYFLKVHLHNFSEIKSQKEVTKQQESRFFFLLLLDDTIREGSGSGSRRPKNIWIRNTALDPARSDRCVSIAGWKDVPAGGAGDAHLHQQLTQLRDEVPPSHPRVNITSGSAQIYRFFLFFDQLIKRRRGCF